MRLLHFISNCMGTIGLAYSLSCYWIEIIAERRHDYNTNDNNKSIYDDNKGNFNNMFFFLYFLCILYEWTTNTMYIHTFCFKGFDSTWKGTAKESNTHTGNLIKKKAMRIAMIINNYHFLWRNMMRLHSWEYDQMMSFLYDIAVRSIDDIKTEKSSFPLRYVQCLVVCLFNNIDNTNNF